MEMQEELQKKLDQFGESFLDKYEVKKKVKTNKAISGNKQNTSSVEQETNQDNVGRDKSKKKKRRRAKKKSDPDKTEDTNPSSTSKNIKSKFISHAKGQNRHLEQLKQDLCLDEFKEKQQKKLMKLDRKKNQLSGKQAEVVVFQSKRPQKNKEKEFDKPKQQNEKEDNTVHIDLDAARSEIQKFSIQGFKGEKKEEMMKNLLIKLGAKPPKGKYHNYKEYQEMKKKEKLEAKEQHEMDRLIGNVVKKKKGVKRKRDMNDVGHVDAQVGRYTPGVLHLKKDDIYRIQNPKKKR